MYSEQDVLRVNAEKRKRLWCAFLVLGLSVLVMIIGLIIRNEILSTYVAALIACLFYAVLELYVMPWVRYGRYMKDIDQGLSRHTDASFVSVLDQPRDNNGVLFYDFVVRVQGEGEDEGERLFYYDADKALPSFSQGEKLHIVSFGNYITDISVR